MRFHDRKEGGERLVSRLRGRAPERPWVLALRGPALEVAEPVAEAFKGQVVPVAVQRASDAPRMEETLKHGGLLEGLGISSDDLQRVASMKKGGARSRRPARPHREALPELTGRPVIIVDDGLSSPEEVARLAGRAAALGPSSLVVAMPVADEDMEQALSEHELIVLRERPTEGPDAEGYIVEDDADAQLRIWHAAREQLKRLAAAPRHEASRLRRP